MTEGKHNLEDWRVLLREIEAEARAETEGEAKGKNESKGGVANGSATEKQI